MKTDRILLVMLLVTIAMQAAILVRQQRQPSPPRASVADGEPAVRAAAPGVVLDIASLPTKGSNLAKVVIVEFSDYECPFCARHAATVGQELQKQFIDAGKIRYVFANNPLSFHPHAELLATSAICGGEQGHYWEMHDVIFADRPRTKDEVLASADAVKLDRTRFTKCLDERHGADRIAKDSEEADHLNLAGTPGFAVGIVDGTNRVRVKILIDGAQPLEVFRGAIKGLADSGT
jgi:protein-disulfide isomerase